MATLAVAAVVVSACSSGHANRPVKQAPTASISLRKAKVQVAARAVGMPVEASGLGTRVSVTYRIGPSGPLPRPAVITLPLTRKVPDNGLTLVFTSESPQGPWKPLATRIIRGGRFAQVTVRHLSYFQAISIDVNDALAALKKFFDDFTGGAFANAESPHCDGQSQALQDGFSVKSSSGDTLLWCFGLENGRRVLKVANNRRYPLLVDHGTPVVGGDTGGDVFQLAARLMSPDGYVIYPTDEADFGADMQAGTWASIHADLGGEAQLLSSLHTGVSALFAIITRFGASDDPNKVMKVVDTLLTADACRSSRSIAAMLSNCLSPAQIAEAFGFPWGLVLAPLAAVSSIIDYFHGVLNGLADSFDNRTKYDITITRSQSWTASELTISPHALGTLTIGMTIAQASAAAGVQLVIAGDGAFRPRGGTPPGLSVGEDPIRCVAAQNAPGAPRVLTPQGFPLGGTLAQLKALYGASLRYVSAPPSGITPYPGYVVTFPDGNLAFLVGNGTVFSRGTVFMIIGGPGVLPSTSCA